MISILYRSEVTRPFTESDLQSLCAVSARKNRTLGITGFLVHIDGVFLQVLEGEEGAVDGIYARIRADDRHHRVTTLLREGGLVQPNFGFWAMNVGPVDDEGFRRAALGGDGGSADFAGRSADPAYALTVVTRAYMHACVLADIDPAAHDSVYGNLPALASL